MRTVEDGDRRWLRVVSRDVGCFVRKILCEIDYWKGGEVCGRVLEEIVDVGGVNLGGVGYEVGDVGKFGMGVERYCVMRLGGGFPDVYEGFVEYHLGKGDYESALITCERFCEVFKSWAWPFVVYGRLLGKRGRVEERRDVGRMALRLPVWTLGGDWLEEVAGWAGFVEGGKSLEGIYGGLMKDERVEEVKEGKKKEQVALDRAAWVLDWWVCKGEKDGWEGVKDMVAELYDEAGLNDIATFVRY